MKKTIKLMLIFVMTIVSFITGVNALTNEKQGSITITNSIEEKEYRIYKIFDLDSYTDINADGTFDKNDGYIYKVPAEWKTFIESTNLFEIDDENYAKWIGAEDEATVRDFAKAALEHAKTNSAINYVGEKTGNGEELTFSGLDIGYYLVDSSVGALCGLSTTKPNADVLEKNSVPTVKKEVQENDSWGSANTAYIEDVVNFKTTITVGKGAENYVLYDKMSSGLTYDSTTLKIQVAGVDVVAANYELPTELGDYTFIVKFKKAYTDALTDGTEIVVTYSATLNKDAVIGGNGNPNTATLKYGDDLEHNKDESITITYTYSFDLVKTDEDKNIIPGAEFELYLKDGDKLGNRIYVVKVSDGLYRVTKTANEVVIEADVATIIGLDKNDYYLVETKNPDGYTKLLTPTEVNITNSNLEAILNTEENKYVSNGIQVINTKGNLLPSTGGICTTLFIVIGSLMVTLFGLLLVTKYRMSKMDI